MPPTVNVYLARVKGQITLLRLDRVEVCLYVLPMSVLRVKELREAAGLSMAELARRAEINQRTIRNIERGTHQPTFTTVTKIATALDVPLQALVQP